MLCILYDLQVLPRQYYVIRSIALALKETGRKNFVLVEIFEGHKTFRACQLSMYLLHLQSLCSS